MNTIQAGVEVAQSPINLKVAAVVVFTLTIGALTVLWGWRRPTK